jgi:hypothetical protein
MNMLTKEDLRQIGDLMDERLEVKLEEKLEEKLDQKLGIFKEAIVTELGEVIEQNLFPKFDDMDAKIAALPDKNFVTEKIGELRGEMVLGFRRQEAYTDELVGELMQVLKDKEVITVAEAGRVDAVRLYPQHLN